MPAGLSQPLRETIDRSVPLLRALTEEFAVRPLRAGGWCAKEELGHLIDSASNNHIRFVRATLESAFEGPSYDQQGWVGLHGYVELSWSSLVEFWAVYNLLLCRIVDRMPEEALSARCVIGSNAPMTLGALIEDYQAHMRHHLEHILTVAQV